MSPNPPIAESGFELKHRIVGASILIILGVVVVPMILSGTNPADNLSVTDTVAKNPDTKVFISKITPIAGVTPALKHETKRSPEGAKTAPKPAKPKSPATTKPTVKASGAELVAKAPTQTPESTVARKTDRKNIKPGKKPTVNGEPIAKTYTKSIERGWIVRIGTFSKPENATRIMSALKTLGFKPSSERVKTSRGVLTRVWVGPYAQRVEAGRARTRIQQTTGEKGLIAAFP
jgi:DedD protein